MQSSGNQTIFIRLAPIARLPLSRNEASDRVPPIQISASGMVIRAKYSPEVSSHSGSAMASQENGSAASTPMISGLRSTLLKMLHGSDFRLGL
ncbi:hypothetical protein D9M71_435580 [compost metagenome]